MTHCTNMLCIQGAGSYAQYPGTGQYYGTKAPHWSGTYDRSNSSPMVFWADFPLIHIDASLSQQPLADRATLEVIKCNHEIHSEANCIFAWGVAEVKCILVTRICVSVCPSLHFHYMDPDVTWGNGRGAVWLCTIGWICNWCTGFVAVTT